MVRRHSVPAAQPAGRVAVGFFSAAFLPARYFFLPACWALFLWLLAAHPLLRLPLLAYLAYLWRPAGARAVASCRWPPLLRRSTPCTYWSNYAPGSRLVKTAELDPCRRFLLGLHPHGVFSNASILALGTEALDFSRLFPGLQLSLGTLGLILKTPFAREVCLLSGWCDVSRRTLLTRLAQQPGAAVAVVVGGAAEAVLAEPGTMDLVLLRRKGFVRIALEAGADLVPVLAFGENEQYHRPKLRPGSWLDRMQTATKKALGFTLPLCYGRPFMGLSWSVLPEPVPIVVVVGAPIQLPAFKGDLRSAEGQTVVDACHARYCAALQALYNAHKDELALGRRRDLQFVA
ncbi:hypothetical protein ABPG75_010845 [Micractinium tetrahymenae]